MSEKSPKARKRHECSLCTGPIFSGTIYSRRVVRGDDFYTWKECMWCIKDQVRSLVSDWTLSSDGIDHETAHSWAIETLRISIPGYQDYEAARKYQWRFYRGGYERMRKSVQERILREMGEGRDGLGTTQ